MSSKGEAPSSSIVRRPSAASRARSRAAGSLDACRQPRRCRASSRRVNVRPQALPPGEARTELSNVLTLQTDDEIGTPDVFGREQTAVVSG